MFIARSDCQQVLRPSCPRDKCLARTLQASPAEQVRDFSLRNGFANPSGSRNYWAVSVTKYLLFSLVALPAITFVVATAGVTTTEFVGAMIGVGVLLIAGGVAVFIHQRSRAAGPRDPSRPL
jgi:hypothetical protein